MRVVVYGTGAIGGTVAAALARAGREVVAIARGAQLDVIGEQGLRLRTPNEDVTVHFPVVGSPQEAGIGPGDAILLTMKGQDTQAALEALRAAGVVDQPIFCLQNGVDNERKALRLFANVHGVAVLMPVSFVRPGEVVSWSALQHGLFETGRPEGGHDADDLALARALTAANIATYPSDAVMAAKYGKLLLNLRNILIAALGAEADTDDLQARLRAEAEAVFAAAGIDWVDVGPDNPRRKAHISWQKIPGIDDVGTSTAQSLARGTGSVETDWLNGEVVLLGRLHGVPVPVNVALTRLAARMAREGAAPGSITMAGLLAEIGD